MKPEQFFRRFFFFFFAGLLLCNQATASLDVNMKRVKPFVLDFGKIYVQDWAALLAHELGHAITAKALLNSPITINLGCEQGKTKIQDIKIKIGNHVIALNSILPVAGWTTIQPPHPQKNAKWKRIAISLIGPLCGALAYYLINIGYYAINDENLHGKIFLKSLFDTSIYMELVRNLLPVEDSDGAYILREFFPDFDTHHIVWQAFMWITKMLIKNHIINQVGDKLYENTPHNICTSYESFKKEFEQREVIKEGTRIIMQNTNNTVGTLKNFLVKKNITNKDVDFTIGDFIKIIWFLWKYPTAVQQTY